MQPSDAPYKVLFQDLGLFADTVRLIAPELAASLDFGTATSLGTEHLTASARTRLQDKLRRVELREGAAADGRRRHVLALFEFQSRHDRDMAWRMRDYLHLVESGLREVGAVKAHGEAPQMLSIVVHNGERPWRAATKWAGPLTGDARPAPLPMYATVDLRRLAHGPDGAGRVLAPGSRLATLAQLEASAAEHLPGQLLAAFRRHDGADAAGFRRGLYLRAQAALAGLGLAQALPPMADLERLLAQRRGEHMTAMLDATLKRWVTARVSQGVERGLAQGMERGMAQGMERGMAQGMEQGVERGLAQGRVALLGRMAERRFGAGVATRLEALLANESDLARLDEAGEWLLDCATGDALLARVRAGRDARDDAS